MSNEELVELYQQGSKHALDELMEQNKGIIYKLANKYYTGKTNSIDREDLEQEGFMGLIIAAGKYDINHVNKANFITYAIYWINQKIIRFLKYRNTNEETSLNIPIGETGNIEIIDFIEGVDYSFENIEDRIYLQQLREELDKVMNEVNTLTEREVLKFHYGWDYEKCMTLKEIGVLFGVNPERIRQIENRAIRKIRKSMWYRIEYKNHYKEIRNKTEFSYSDVENSIDFMNRYLG